MGAGDGFGSDTDRRKVDGIGGNFAADNGVPGYAIFTFCDWGDSGVSTDTCVGSGSLRSETQRRRKGWLGEAFGVGAGAVAETEGEVFAEVVGRGILEKPKREAGLMLGFLELGWRVLGSEEGRLREAEEEEGVAEAEFPLQPQEEQGGWLVRWRLEKRVVVGSSLKKEEESMVAVS